MCVESQSIVSVIFEAEFAGSSFSDVRISAFYLSFMRVNEEFGGFVLLVGQKK